MTGNYLSIDASMFSAFSAGNGADSFTIDGNPTIDLNGGAGDDTFAFTDGAVLNGTIDGETGSDALDLNAYTSGSDHQPERCRVSGRFPG